MEVKKKVNESRRKGPKVTAADMMLEKEPVVKIPAVMVDKSVAPKIVAPREIGSLVDVARVIKSEKFNIPIGTRLTILGRTVGSDGKPIYKVLFLKRFFWAVADDLKDKA